MKRIAILFDGSLNDRKGLVNAVLSRSKHLIKIAKDMEIDIYNFSSYDDWLIRYLRKTTKTECLEDTYIEGLKIKTYWYPFTIIDYILEIKCKYKAVCRSRAYLKRVTNFAKYDLISAHSMNCGSLAMEINKKYGIPFVITWHGSDIHTTPFTNKYKRNEVIRIAKKAKYNFFVSKALSLKSEEFISDIRKELLYNGVAPTFICYDEKKKKELRIKYKTEGKKIVCFAGNIIGIKNPETLPPIFKKVKEKYNYPVKFWIIGDGKLRHNIETLFKQYSLDYTCWGNIPSEFMPEMLNCVDVQVLPSKNEGLPLITLEALACGANVVGSNVGGISEAIGKEFTYNLDNDFIENISTKIVELLNRKSKQELSDIFNWEKSAEKEYSLLNNIFE